MTDTTHPSILDDGATDSQSIERLKNGEAAVQEELLTSLTSTIIDSITADGDATPQSSNDILKASLTELQATDPEMAKALKEVLDDPEVIAMMGSMDRVSSNTATEADLELLGAGQKLPEFDAPGEPSLEDRMKDAAAEVETGALTRRGSRLYDDLNKVEKTKKLFDGLKAGAARAGKGAWNASTHSVYYTLDYFSGGKFDAEAHITAPPGKTAKAVSKYGGDVVGTGLSGGLTLAGLGASGYGLYSGINQLENGDKTEGGLAVASASLGIAKGTYQLTKLVSSKLATKLGPGAAGDIAKVLGGTGMKAGSALSKRAAAFAFGVGSAFAVAAGVISITQNALALDKALKSDQEGVAAVYGAMIALDAVGMGLDIASLACDFIPGGQLVSLVLDVVNLAITGVNIGLGFVVDLVVDKDQLQEDAWEQYLSSPGFNKYMDGLADSFKNAGYDSLEVIVDSANSGVPDYGTGNILESKQKRLLSEMAKTLPDSRDLRMAILDQSVSGHNLSGRDNDDFIAGGQGADRIHGFGGNDYLLGQQGNDVIFGGDGDDIIIPGLGRDTVDAGAGNDNYYVEVGADKAALGGPGDSDTAHLVTGMAPFAYNGTFGDATSYIADYSGGVDIHTKTDLARDETGYGCADLVDGSILDHVGNDFVDECKKKVYLHPHSTESDRMLKKPDGQVALDNYFFKLGQGNWYKESYNVHNGQAHQINNQEWVLFAKKQWQIDRKYLGSTNGGWHTYDRHEAVYYNFKTDQLMFTRIDTDNSAHNHNSHKYRKVNNASKVMYDYLVGHTEESANNLGWGQQVSYLIAARHGHLNHTTDLESTENVIGTNITDHIFGADNNNYLDGGKNKDGVRGDYILGRGGDDTLVFNNLNDEVSGGSGKDTLIMNVGDQNQDVTWDLKDHTIAIGDQKHKLDYSGVERFVTGSANYTVNGGDRNNTVITGAGNNTVNAGMGNDTLIAGSDGENTLNGEEGHDSFILTAEGNRSTANGAEGNDIFYGGTEAVTINGGEGFDTYVHSGDGKVSVDLASDPDQITVIKQDGSGTEVKHAINGIESIHGGKKRDVLLGDENDNIFNGGGLVDTLKGRDGNDLFVVDKIVGNDRNLIGQRTSGNYDGGDGSDTVNYEDLDYKSFQKGTTEFVVNLGGAQNHIQGAGVKVNNQKKTFHVLNSIENVVGTRDADKIYGNDADNVLDGLEGEDIIYGYGGNDTLSAKEGQLVGGSGHDTYLIRRDSRNVIVKDLDFAQADRIVFDGVSMEEVKLKLTKDGMGLDALAFQINDEKGKTVTLASWTLPPGSVTNDSWHPLFESVVKGLYNISFIDPLKEGETSRNSITLENAQEITAFLYSQLVVTSQSEAFNAKDSRGRDVQITGNNAGVLGSRGNDVLRAGEEESSTDYMGFGYRVTGGEGADVLINSDVKKTTWFDVSEDDAVDGRLGNGYITQVAGSDLSNASVIVGGKSGHYTFDQDLANPLKMDLIIDGDADLVKGIEGDKLLLSGGGSIQLYSGGDLAFDSICFNKGDFNGGKAFKFSTFEELDGFVRSAVLHGQLLNGELNFTNFSRDDVKLSLGKAEDGSDILKFQTKQDGQTVTLVEMPLPDGTVTNDSWSPLFDAVTSQLKTVQFADGVSLETDEVLEQFLYDQLVVIKADDLHSYNNYVVKLSEQAEDDRGRDYQLLSNQHTLSGTSGDDVLRAGNFDRFYMIRGGEGRDRLVNSALAFTAFTLTEDDTLDAREGGGSLILSGNKLDDAQIILGAASKDYEVYTNASSSNLNLIIDGDTSLIAGISGDKLMLSGGGSIELFDRKGRLIADSIRFTQGDFNGGNSTDIHSREDLVQLVDSARAYSQMKEIGIGSLTNVALDDVSLQLGTNSEGTDVLKLQVEQGGTATTVGEVALSKEAVASGSWAPVFEEALAQLDILQFAQGETLKTEADIQEFLYDRLVKGDSADFDYGVNNGITDSRGRDVLLKDDQYDLVGTKGSDIFRVGGGQKDNVLYGGQGSDLMINAKRNVPVYDTDFYVTSEDIVDGREGCGYITYLSSGADLDDTTVVLGRSSGQYTVNAHTKRDLDMNLVLDGNVDLIKNISGSNLHLEGGGQVNLFSSGHQTFDSIQFTQGDFNNGEAFEVNNRSDLDKLVEQIAAFKASSDDSSDFTTTDSSYQISHPLNNLAASSIA